MERRLTRIGVVAAVACAVLGAAASAPASPYVHAHRGGSLATVGGEQRPVYPESSLSAYRESAQRGFVLELDVKLTADRVPVVIHDATLERTTDCEGRVDSLTFAQLRSRCELDTLGTEGAERPLDPGDERRAAVPSLRAGAEAGARARIGDQPGDQEPPVRSRLRPDPRLRDDGRGGDQDQRLPARPADRAELPAAEPRGDRGRPLLRARRDVLPDPEEPRGRRARDRRRLRVRVGLPAVAGRRRATSSEAHALGLRVVPFTIDDATELRAATRAGVDAVITNDPRLARRSIRAAFPKPPKPPPAAEPPRVPSRRRQRPGPADRELPSRRLGPARVRDPVQAGPRERRHLRGLPGEDRVPDPRVRRSRGWRTTAPTSSP